MGLRHTLVRNSWPTAPTMLDASVDSCIYVYVALETSRSRIRRRLEEDGWYLDRHGANHDIYRHLKVSGIITLPQHPVDRSCPVHCQEGRMAHGVRMN